mmetsp:Transcript_16483/g.29764  ORF Transcript_16483/g.29764 Transcript_16483/m.29764 type:complete len:299 (+) Transcript_16483:255-1151(+)
MLGMLSFKVLHRSKNDIKTTILTHSLGREVSVATSTIPVTWNWLRIKRHNDSESFAYTVHDVTRHHELITRVNTDTRTNLIFPLTSHDFSIASRDGNTSIQTSTVVSLYNLTTERVFSTSTAVIWTLWTRVSIVRPAKWSTSISIEESVLLFDTEPWYVFLDLLKELESFTTSIGWDRSRFGIWKSALTQYKNVWTWTEWIWIDSNRMNVDFRVLTWSLTSRRTIKVPYRQIINRLDLLVQSTGLAAKFTFTSDPYILGLNNVLRQRQTHKALEYHFTFKNAMGLSSRHSTTRHYELV